MKRGHHRGPSLPSDRASLGILCKSLHSAPLSHLHPQKWIIRTFNQSCARENLEQKAECGELLLALLSLPLFWIQIKLNRGRNSPEYKTLCLPGGMQVGGAAQRGRSRPFGLSRGTWASEGEDPTPQEGHRLSLKERKEAGRGWVSFQGGLMGGGRTPAQSAPSCLSSRMHSTDLWRMAQSCKDRLRSEKVLRGTSTVPILQRQ